MRHSKNVTAFALRHKNAFLQFDIPLTIHRPRSTYNNTEFTAVTIKASNNNTQINLLFICQKYLFKLHLQFARMTRRQFTYTYARKITFTLPAVSVSRLPL